MHKKLSVNSLQKLAGLFASNNAANTLYYNSSNICKKFCFSIFFHKFYTSSPPLPWHGQFDHPCHSAFIPRIYCNKAVPKRAGRMPAYSSCLLFLEVNASPHSSLIYKGEGHSGNGGKFVSPSSKARGVWMHVCSLIQVQ